MKSIDDILKMAANVQEELTKAQANLETIVWRAQAAAA